MYQRQSQANLLLFLRKKSKLLKKQAKETNFDKHQIAFCGRLLAQLEKGLLQELLRRHAIR